MLCKVHTSSSPQLLARGVIYSGIAVMSLEGMQDVQLVEGTANREKFEQRTGRSLKTLS